MSQIVIFCESYDEIETALYVMTHNCDNRSITVVIPGNHDLFNFFNAVNERLFHNSINIIYFEVYSGRRAKANKINIMLHCIPDIIKERQYLRGIFNRYFAKLKGAEVYFLARYMNPVTFYFVNKSGKRNKLVYMHYARYADPVEKYTPKNIIDLVSLIILKLIYGRDIAMGKLPYTKGFAYMPDKFMEKEVDRVIDGEERNKIMKDFDLSQFKIFDVGNYSVIYFDQHLIDTGYIPDRDIFKRELNEIFNILSKYFPEKKIARKYHPHYPCDKTMIKIGDVLPDFIPAELLYNDNVKMYLSLFSCSIANVERGLAVSIADLITFRDEETRNQLKEALIQRSRSEILFPKSLEEFERILVNVKGK